jgi:hypothetical protein
VGSPAFAKSLTTGVSAALLTKAQKACLSSLLVPTEAKGILISQGVTP